MLIPNCTSCKDVYILAKYTLNRENGTVVPITWFNPPKAKPSPPFRALCGTVCALSIAIVLTKLTHCYPVHFIYII